MKLVDKYKLNNLRAMDKIKLKVRIKRAILDGIKYHYEMAEIGRACNFDQFAEDRVKDFIEACEGCQKAAEYPTGKYCTVSPDPAAKWSMGACNMATHIQASAKKDAAKVNPLKASKRASH